MKRAGHILFVLMLLIPLSPALAETTIKVGQLDVAVWLPKKAGKGTRVILFSHGFHGCNTQSPFLMEALAKAGYAVFAPNHADATCNNGKASLLERPEEPFRNARSWTDDTYADRRDDMEALLDGLPNIKRYAYFDWERVGLVGHSLGGHTVLGLAGAWQSWRDDRVVAVLALSPYAQVYMEDNRLAGITVPVMYQSGTRDFGINMPLRRKGGAYDQTQAPKWYVEFDGAGHLAWAGKGGEHHADIVD